MASSEAAARGRTVIVGDVHGCRQELEDLLAAVRFAPHSDRLVFVGDVVVKGPDPHGVLALVARRGARAVRGNHEAKLLEWRADRSLVHGEHGRLAETLSEDEWRTLEAMPSWLALPEHGVCVVHAGVVPGTPIADTPVEARLRIRAVDPHGRWTDDKRAPGLWGALYVGPPHVVFGHNALPEPQIHDWATGIDTGCVYGGRLTAVVLAAGEPMPRGRGAVAKLVSVPARRTYVAAGPGEGGG